MVSPVANHIARIFILATKICDNPLPPPVFADPPVFKADFGLGIAREKEPNKPSRVLQVMRHIEPNRSRNPGGGWGYEHHLVCYIRGLLLPGASGSHLPSGRRRQANASLSLALVDGLMTAALCLSGVNGLIINTKLTLAGDISDADRHLHVQGFSRISFVEGHVHENWCQQAQADAANACKPIQAIRRGR